MKTLSLIISLAILAVTTGVSAQNQTQTQTQSHEQKELELAKEGCHKKLGFFPTPSKLQCVLTSLGLSKENTKPKALAIIFTVCQGHLPHSQPGVTPKAHPTLASCLSNPESITLINKELSAQGFSEIKVVNPSILNAPTTTKPTS